MNALYDFANAGGLPPFSSITPEHVVPAMKKLLEELATARAALEKTVQPTWESVVERVADLVEPIERAWGAVSHLNAVKNSPALREAHQAMQPEVVASMLALAQSEPLHQALQKLASSPELEKLGAARKRICRRSSSRPSSPASRFRRRSARSSLRSSSSCPSSARAFRTTSSTPPRPGP